MRNTRSRAQLDRCGSWEIVGPCWHRCWPCDSVTYFLFLLIEGPGLIDVIVMPFEGAELVRWNLSHVGPASELTWSNQKIFFIRRSRGLEIQRQWSFWLEFNVSVYQLFV